MVYGMALELLLVLLLLLLMLVLLLMLLWYRMMSYSVVMRLVV